MELIEGNAWVPTANGDTVEVRMAQLVYTTLVYKERFNDRQLRRVKAAIDREILRRSKLINSQKSQNPKGGIA